MRKVAIVILNYLNYADTMECVDSILKMKYPICGIVIVDNGSYNDSYCRLKKAYRKIPQITIISCKKNKGYAKGNNQGIRYARKKLRADFVLVVNNDTVFTDKNYIEVLLNKYEQGVGVIGSKIILKDGSEHGEAIEYLELKYFILNYINRLSKQCGSCFDFSVEQKNPTPILQGCALLFTPDFFASYKGFYKHTFLYMEEPILYLMCQCRRLRQVYVPEVKIYHKEDQSSFMSFQNDISIRDKYVCQSTKYVIFWLVKYNIIKMFRKN